MSQVVRHLPVAIRVRMAVVREIEVTFGVEFVRRKRHVESRDFEGCEQAQQLSLSRVVMWIEEQVELFRTELSLTLGGDLTIMRAAKRTARLR